MRYIGILLIVYHEILSHHLKYILQALFPLLIIVFKSNGMAEYFQSKIKVDDDFRTVMKAFCRLISCFLHSATSINVPNKNEENNIYTQKTIRRSDLCSGFHQRAIALNVMLHWTNRAKKVYYCFQLESLHVIVFNFTSI